MPGNGIQPAPPDITTHAILTAKLETLKWWISRANTAARACGEKKNPLTKTGNANALRKKVAGYYGVNLDIPVIPVVSQKTKDADTLNATIRARQWMHMRALGTEWKERSAKKEPFILCERGA